MRFPLAAGVAASVAMSVISNSHPAAAAPANASGPHHEVTLFRGISDPAGIVAGPDGALWFTNNRNNSIGRITTTGAVTIYSGTGVDEPNGIAAGADGALWFTNFGDNSIGRITTTGKVTTYHDASISGSLIDRGWIGRRTVVCK